MAYFEDCYPKLIYARTGMKTQTIREFESLRGYMALWVVIGHSMLQFPDYLANVPVVKYLLYPSIAVYVFMMLSGFVIFYLLDSKKEQYFVFLIRRALRLFPIYLCVLFVSILIFEPTLNLLVTLFEKYPDTKHLINCLRIYRATEVYFIENILSHIFLLQGVIPETIIPEGQYAFVGQAWSLSLEWQFYIVAPICTLILYKKNEFAKLLMPILLMGAYFLLRDLNFAFIFGYKLVYFIIGGASYYLWKNLVSIGESGKILNMSFLVTLLLMLKLLGLGLADMIWIVVFFTALCNYLDCQNGITRFVSFFMLNSIARFLGQISYSIYLNHTVVLYGLLILIQSMDMNLFNIGDSLFLVVLFASSVVILTIVISSITYRYIEKPFIDLGKRCFVASDQIAVATERG
jgi:peptidoglycan/LPS O-acetylase OafA/YrhL